MVHEADPEIILEAFVAEIVRKSYVENISIPAWVFEAFGHTPENRNFRFEDIINKEKGPDYWGTNAGYPDYSNQETLYWYYYCIRRYIDIGFECIHIQENDEQDLSEIANVDKLLTMCREYAKTKARRGVVLFHSFFSMVNGGAKVGDRLLFDIQGNGLVPNETKKEVVDGETVMKCEISHYEDCWLSWFGRSNGGEHPLGFQVEICPTILEFDNYGGNGKPAPPRRRPSITGAMTILPGLPFSPNVPQRVSALSRRVYENARADLGRQADVLSRLSHGAASSRRRRRPR